MVRSNNRIEVAVTNEIDKYTNKHLKLSHCSEQLTLILLLSLSSSRGLTHFHEIKMTWEKKVLDIIKVNT